MISRYFRRQFLPNVEGSSLFSVTTEASVNLNYCTYFATHLR